MNKINWNIDGELLSSATSEDYELDFDLFKRKVDELIEKINDIPKYQPVLIRPEGCKSHDLLAIPREHSELIAKHIDLILNTKPLELITESVSESFMDCKKEGQ